MHLITTGADTDDRDYRVQLGRSLAGVHPLPPLTNAEINEPPEDLGLVVKRYFNKHSARAVASFTVKRSRDPSICWAVLTDNSYRKTSCEVATAPIDMTATHDFTYLDYCLLQKHLPLIDNPPVYRWIPFSAWNASFDQPIQPACARTEILGFGDCTPHLYIDWLSYWKANREAIAHIIGTPATGAPWIKSLVAEFVDNPDGADTDNPKPDKEAEMIEWIKQTPSPKGTSNLISMAEDQSKYFIQLKSHLYDEHDEARDAARLVYLIRETLPQLAQSISKIGLHSFLVNSNRYTMPMLPIRMNQWNEIYRLPNVPDMILLYKNGVSQFRNCFVANNSPNDFYIYPRPFWENVENFQ